MRMISLTLLALGAAALATPAWAAQEGPGGKAPKDKKGLDQAELVLTEKEQGKLGLFVVTELDQGVRGKALAEAIAQELVTLKAERESDKKKETPDGDKDKKGAGDQGPADKNGPGEALKHGLSDKDLTIFGKFVNEQLAAGLRGEELADAIQKKHEELRAARAADHSPAEHPATTPPHPRHRPPGHH